MTRMELSFFKMKNILLAFSLGIGVGQLICQQGFGSNFMAAYDHEHDNDNKRPAESEASASTLTKEPPKIGVVTVDVRADGSIGSRVVPQVQRLLHVTDVPVEVWVSKAALTNLTKIFHSNPRVSVRPMAASHTIDNHTIDLQGRHGGFIGKAYALKNSKFDFAILFDGDVWPCSTTSLKYNKTSFVDEVEKHFISNSHGQVDVLWTTAPIPHGGTYGNNDGHVDPQIDEHVDAYRQFTERNSGTIVAVRRTSKAVQKWLSLAMDIYIQQHHATTPDGSKLLRPYADQPALREAYFVHRHELKENILDSAKGCRNSIYDYKRPETCVCACDCTPCILLHMPREFDTCNKIFQKEQRQLPF